MIYAVWRKNAMIRTFKNLNNKKAKRHVLLVQKCSTGKLYYDALVCSWLFQTLSTKFWQAPREQLNRSLNVSWNNAFWPTAAVDEADSVNSVSASACHIGGPKGVGPGQKALLHGNVFWICQQKENLFVIPALLVLWIAQCACFKNHKTKTSVDALLILLVDALPKSDPNHPNSHSMGQLLVAQSWSWLTSPTKPSWKFSSISVPTRTSPMCHLSANDSTKYLVTI